jgi:phosphohistidine phosphatase SixA
MTPGSERFWIVRHACAGHKEPRSERPDDERPLNPAGVQQAEALCNVLVEQRPTRLVSSPVTRCLQTLQPLARALHLTVESSADLAADNGAETLIRSFDVPPFGAVLCTHGEVMKTVIGRFAELDVNVDERARDAILLKGTAWQLERSERVWSLTVVAPIPRHECPSHPNEW